MSLSGVSGWDEQYRYPDILIMDLHLDRAERGLRLPWVKSPCLLSIAQIISQRLPPHPLTSVNKSTWSSGVEIKIIVDYQQLFSLVLLCFQEYKKIFISCFWGEHVVVCSYLEIFRYRRPATFLLSDLINSVHVKQALILCKE